MDLIRKNVIDEMIESVGKETWNQNMLFVHELVDLVKNHKIKKHPIVTQLANNEFSLQEIQTMHMEYREIVHIFTDALLMAQFQSKRVENVMKPGSKAYARFLLTLNTLDEFGFHYKIGEPCDFQGTPQKSHLILFENLMTDLSITDQDRERFTPSAMTLKLKECFLTAYDDYPLLLTLLAIAEEIVMIFSPVMRLNTGALGIPVEQGYYQVHGVSDDEENNACDDYHQNDLWLILAQGAGGFDKKSLMENTKEFIDLWDEFWTQGFSNNKVESMRSTASKVQNTQQAGASLY
ncbi:hypothetical protein [Leucothrix arctica]|uniref:Iron-containing redox enzyme family protein n=1 Tax=Leucothrix arctica TaxID=1481894 RepID=A0A317CAC5_9GAMM|nr:hypothetical protein [Leucothrix arctica]PWQ95327.1 hypothetical protein DKT75_13390 [Leucothrix arctica]